MQVPDFDALVDIAVLSDFVEIVLCKNLGRAPVEQLKDLVPGSMHSSFEKKNKLLEMLKQLHNGGERQSLKIFKPLDVTDLRSQIIFLAEHIELERGISNHVIREQLALLNQNSAAIVSYLQQLIQLLTAATQKTN